MESLKKRRIDVISINSPYDFWICEKSHVMVLDYINNLILHDNTNNKDKRNFYVKENEMIAVRPNNNHWYRAVILEVNKDKKRLLCRLIDTGMITHVSISNCTGINNKILLEAEPFAKHCKLYGIKPNTNNAIINLINKSKDNKWNAIACDFFKKKCKKSTNKVFIEYKTENSSTKDSNDTQYSVIIYTKDVTRKCESYESINELLIKEEFALSTGDENLLFKLNEDDFEELNFLKIDEEHKRNANSYKKKSDIFEQLGMKLESSEKVKAKTQIPLEKPDDNIKKKGLYISGCSKLDQYHDLLSAPIDDHLKQYIGMYGLSKISEYQSYLWPLIMQGNHLCAVTPSVKLIDVKNDSNQMEYFMDYLIPLLTRTIKIVTTKELDITTSEKTSYVSSPTNGPILIVICSSCKNGQRIFEDISDILKRNKSIGLRVIYLEGGTQNETDDLKLYNGCDILICATPLVLLRKLAKFQTNLERLKYIVFDQADYLLNNFEFQIKVLMRTYGDLLNIKSHIKVAQFILYSKHWSKNLKAFMSKYFKHGSLIFGSKLEASYYANVRHFVEYCEKIEIKIRKLSDIMCSRSCNSSIAVIVNSKKSANLIEEHFKRCVYQYKTLDDNLMDFQIQKMCKDWNLKAEKPIVIIHQKIIDYIRIGNFDSVINFDLPLKKDQFGNSMWLMREKFDQNASKSDKSSINLLTCYTFIDSNDLPNCNRLLDYLIRIETPNDRISKCLFDSSTIFCSIRDSIKKQLPLCTFIKSYGKCTLPKYSCEMRHFVDVEVDKHRKLTSDFSDPILCVPFEGIVKFKVVYVKDTNNFFIHILNNKYEDDNKNEITNEYNLFNDLDLELQNFYANHENKQFVTELNLDTLYACKDKGLSVYKRVKIINATQIISAFASKLHVLFIDYGYDLEISSEELMYLPEKFTYLPGQAVEVVTCNLKPTDKDIHWSVASQIAIANKLMAQKVFYGRIQLSAGNTLWLSPIVSYKKLEMNNTIIFDDYLKRDMLENQYATKNPEHLKLLRELFKEAHIKIPKIIEIGHLPYKTLEAQFAFLDSDKEYNDVCITRVINYNTFYIQKRDSIELIDSLENDIEKYIKENENDDDFVKTKKSLLYTIKESDKLPNDCYCIAKQPAENKLNRAKVIDYNYSKNQVQVHFVDYGDVSFVNENDLFPLPDKFIQRLPFQAIKCRLNGLTILENVHNPIEWEKDVSDALWNITHDSEDFSYKCKVIIKRNLSNITASKEREYEVELYLAEFPMLISVKHRLIAEKKVLLASDEEAKLFQFVKQDVEPFTTIDILTKMCVKNLYKEENLKFIQSLNSRSNEILRLSFDEIKNSGLIQTLSTCILFTNQSNVLESILNILKRYFSIKEELLEVFCESNGINNLLNKCEEFLDKNSVFLSLIINWLNIFHSKSYILDLLISNKDLHLMLWYIIKHCKNDEIMFLITSMISNIIKESDLKFILLVKDFEFIEKIIIREKLENELFLDYYESNIQEENNALMPIVRQNYLPLNESNDNNDEESNDSSVLEEFYSDFSKCLMEVFNKSQQNHINYSEEKDIWSDKPYLYPKKIIWNQDNQTVTLKVLFSDSIKMNLKIDEPEFTDSSIDFRAKLNDKDYGFEFQFYSDIIGTHSVFEVKTTHIEIKLIKKLNEIWPRLLQQMNKPRFIVSEFDNINENDDEEPEERMCLVPPPNESESDNSSDDSIIVDDTKDLEDIYWD